MYTEDYCAPIKITRGSFKSQRREKLHCSSTSHLMIKPRKLDATVRRIARKNKNLLQPIRWRTSPQPVPAARTSITFLLPPCSHVYESAVCRMQISTSRIAFEEAFYSGRGTTGATDQKTMHAFADATVTRKRLCRTTSPPPFKFLLDKQIERLKSARGAIRRQPTEHI